MSKTFSDYAYEELINRYNNHDGKVGSKLKQADPQKYSDYESTDCITYALNVISHAFTKLGKTEAASKAWSLGKHGNELAAYLVNKHNWKGVYINPDVFHPKDADTEHTFSRIVANRKCIYYDIPLEYKVVNYRPTTRTSSAFQAVSRAKGLTKLNNVDIGKLKNVRFGFGISRGGMHTWLFSKGYVYEVHWDKVGKDLYERSLLENYPWLSGAIVIPQDAAGELKLAELTCKVAN